MDLRCGGGDEPYFRVEAVEMRECIVEYVELGFDVQFVFCPADEADVDGVVARTATVGESLICCLCGGVSGYWGLGLDVRGVRWNWG